MTDESDRLRVMIVDDEEPARLALRQALDAIGGVEIVAECANGFEAVKVVGEMQPDVVLLDVQMPKLDGFDVLELLGRRRAGHLRHGVRRVRAAGVRGARGGLSAEAVQRRAAGGGARPCASATGAASVDPAELRASARPPGAPLERVVIRDGAQVHVVAGRAHRLRRGAGRLRRVPDGRQDAAEGADARRPRERSSTRRRFVRIHRSYLLNIERLARVELYAKDSRVAILADGTKLPVSRSGYQRLQQLL